MKLNAMFILEDVSMKKMLEFDPKQRLDYVLGIKGEDYFEKHLVDMSEFILYPPEAHKIIQKILLSFEELSVYNLRKIYEDDYYYFYTLNNEQINKLYKKVSNINWSNVIDEVAKINLYRISNSIKDEVLDYCYYFSEMTKKAQYANNKTLVSFSY